jgi:hypothetical protein
VQAGKLPRWLTDSIALFEYAAAADDFEHNGAPSEGRKLRPKRYEPKQVNQLGFNARVQTCDSFAYAAVFLAFVELD